MVAEAFTAMVSERRRSAALFLPQDLMAEEVSEDRAEPSEDFEHPAVDEEHIHVAASLLRKARRPLLLAGGGAIWSGAGPQLKQLAERLDCPAITTLNG